MKRVSVLYLNCIINAVITTTYLSYLNEYSEVNMCSHSLGFTSRN